MIRFEKGEKKVSQKAVSNTGSIAVKRLRHALYQMRHQSCYLPGVFCSVDNSNHTLGDGV